MPRDPANVDDGNVPDKARTVPTIAGMFPAMNGPKVKRVFVAGTWSAAKAEPYRNQATVLGVEIARRGFDLGCGPGTGIARHVIDGFRSVGSAGKVRYVLPAAEHMKAVGEDVEPGADSIEQTPFDYPMRNVYQVGQSDGLFVLTGGDGALEEILCALIDYRIPVGIVRDSGSASHAVQLLLGLYPEWEDLLHFGNSVSEVVEAFFAAVGAASG